MKLLKGFNDKLSVKTTLIKMAVNKGEMPKSQEAAVEGFLSLVGEGLGCGDFSSP